MTFWATAESDPMDVLFLFPGSGRMDRLDGQTDGTTPREFFYGMNALAADGHVANFADSRRDPMGVWPRAHLKWEVLRNKLMRYGTSAERVRAVRAELMRCDIAISFTDGFSISLGRHARRFGINARLIGGFHGISTFTERTPPALRTLAEARTRAGLRGLDHAFFLGAPEKEYAIDHYGLDPGRTSLFNFGIDTVFWTPAPANQEGEDRFVFAAGSDPSRDYDTLMAARFDAPLRILSGLKLQIPDDRPVEHISGSFHDIAITDIVLRDIYRHAALVIVPLKDVLQPTGQSVTLQAMACGKPVVLSDIRGLWDRTAFVSGENCMLVPPGDSNAMGEAISILLKDDALRQRMGVAARQTAERVFSLARMETSVRNLVNIASTPN